MIVDCQELHLVLSTFEDGNWVKYPTLEQYIVHVKVTTELATLNKLHVK